MSAQPELTFIVANLILALWAVNLLTLVHHMVGLDATVLGLYEDAPTPTLTRNFCAANEGSFAVCHLVSCGGLQLEGWPVAALPVSFPLIPTA